MVGGLVTGVVTAGWVVVGVVACVGVVVPCRRITHPTTTTTAMTSTALPVCMPPDVVPGGRAGWVI